MHVKKLGDFLNSSDGIGALMPQAAALLTVRKALCGALPDHLLRSVAIANYRQGKVVFLAASNAVAARLRLLEPRMLEVLSGCGVNVTGMTVEVQPARQPAAEPPARTGRRLPAPAARALARASGRLRDGELRRIVQDLAAKGE
jgi:hypothetical protein